MNLMFISVYYPFHLIFKDNYIYLLLIVLSDSVDIQFEILLGDKRVVGRMFHC